MQRWRTIAPTPYMTVWEPDALDRLATNGNYIPVTRQEFQSHKVRRLSLICLPSILPE